MFFLFVASNIKYISHISFVLGVNNIPVISSTFNKKHSTVLSEQVLKQILFITLEIQKVLRNKVP